MEPTSHPLLKGSVTEDRLLGGKIVLRQGQDGYRAGMDAALLAAACDAGAGARVLEAGCGAGGALLAAAVRRPDASFLGVERDAAAAEFAGHNTQLNKLQERVEIVQGDVSQPFRALGLAPFDAAMSNPPFFDDPGALRAPAAAKRGAWMAEGGLGVWASFLLKAVREGAKHTPEAEAIFRGEASLPWL